MTRSHCKTVWKNGVLIKRVINGKVVPIIPMPPPPPQKILRVIRARGKAPRIIPIDLQPQYLAISPDKWPVWAKALKLLRKPEDKGVGDTIKRVIGDHNSDKFQVWYKKIFGKGCGCVGRLLRYNEEFPYNP